MSEVDAQFHRRAPTWAEQRALRQRRALLVLAAPLIVLGVAFDQPIFLLGALCLALLDIVPELWNLVGLRSITIARFLQYRSVEYGGGVEVALVVENRKALPLPWLEVRDEFPEGLIVAGRRLAPSARIGRASLQLMLALAPYQRIRRRYRLLAVERGVFSFGPTAISTSDPFGLITVEGEQDTGATLVVHPLVAPLEVFGLPPRAPLGDLNTRARLLEDPLRTIGVREYSLGDEPRRVHWKATARMGALQSKVYQPSTRQALIICLNLRTGPDSEEVASDQALTELAISAAASVATWARVHGHALGLCANGSLRMRSSELAAEASYSDPGARIISIAPSANPTQLTTILDGLARLLPFHPGAMDALLEHERWRWPTGATVVYIGADSALTQPLRSLLRKIRASGHSISVLLTQSGEEAALHTAPALHEEFPSHIIGGRRHWRKLMSDALTPDLASQLTHGSKPAFIAIAPLHMEAERSRWQPQQPSGGDDGIEG